MKGSKNWHHRTKEKKSSSIAAAIIYRNKYHYMEFTLLMILTSVSQASYQFQVRSAELEKLIANAAQVKSVETGNTKNVISFKP